MLCFSVGLCVGNTALATWGSDMGLFAMRSFSSSVAGCHDAGAVGCGYLI